MLRVLFQTNPAKFRVSKVGFDAGTGTSDQMLIDTTLINLKVLTSGRLQMASGTSHDVLLGITLPDKPGVMFQTAEGNAYSLLPFQKQGFQGVALTCTPAVDKVTFHNLSGLTKWFSYIVVAVTLPA